MYFLTSIFLKNRIERASKILNSESLKVFSLKSRIILTTSIQYYTRAIEELRRDPKLFLFIEYRLSANCKDSTDTINMRAQDFWVHKQNQQHFYISLVLTRNCNSKKKSLSQPQLQHRMQMQFQPKSQLSYLQSSTSSA